ncbi:hypothetical protein V6N13_145622 [Hibiscus sabdariffa]
MFHLFSLRRTIVIKDPYRVLFPDTSSHFHSSLRRSPPPLSPAFTSALSPALTSALSTPLLNWKQRAEGSLKEKQSLNNGGLPLRLQRYSAPKNKSWINQKTEEELEDLEDDLDDDRFLEEYRKKRLAEMREAAKVSKYGSVMQISGSDFVREVSQAPQDVWVVVLLYKEGFPECGLLLRCLEELAVKYPATKFVKIISTDCIPNYPDRNLPTLLVYNSGAVKANYVGLHSFGRRCTPEGVALVLCQSDPVLNDGQSGSDQSQKAVLEGIRRRFIEKVVTEHEDHDDEGSSSD